jgi:uncharacterized protein (TIGR00730 family)
MQNIAVFCGSSIGSKDIYRRQAIAFSRLLCEHGLGLVYGAGNIGLMGVVADEVLSHGGRVIGVIPHMLKRREVCHEGLHELHVVESMSERKELIGALSDAFVALPGGFGTLDELAEVLTWYQLGLTQKPCALLNIDGYWNPLIQLFDKMAEEKFIRTEHRANIIIESEPEVLIKRLLNFEPLQVDAKWIEQLKEKNKYD